MNRKQHNGMEKHNSGCYNSNYNIITLEKYVGNINEYGFHTLKIIGKEQSIFEELRKDILHDFRVQLFKNEQAYMNKSQKVESFAIHESNFDYLLIDPKVLVDDLYWEDRELSHFLLSLIGLLDYPEDKFILFKNLYHTKCSFYIKVKRTLRNIGVFPIDAKDCMELKSFNIDFDLQYLSLSFWISNLPVLVTHQDYPQYL